MRQRERSRERPRNRKTACVGLRIIINHVHVPVTIFDAEDTVIIYSIKIFPTNHVADKVAISAYLLQVRVKFPWSHRDWRISLGDKRLGSQSWHGTHLYRPPLPAYTLLTVDGKAFVFVITVARLIGKSINITIAVFCVHSSGLPQMTLSLTSISMIW